MAEQRVLAASSDQLRVVALRPHFIWGPGDRHLLPRLITRAKAGRLRQIGTRDPKCDTIYIDNCVDAHLLASDRLLSGAPISGKAYFISDDAPLGVWTMANRMLACAGLGPVGKPVPAKAAYVAGAFFEAFYWLLGVDEEPLVTRFGASELSYAQWFDISAAKTDLGYRPRVSVEEGLERLARSLKPDEIRDTPVGAPMAL
jgi:nucleoside-diphosphate-sugar epimerase